MQHGRSERQDRTHTGGHERVRDALRGMRWRCDDPDSNVAICDQVLELSAITYLEPGDGRSDLVGR